MIEEKKNVIDKKLVKIFELLYLSGEVHLIDRLTNIVLHT